MTDASFDFDELDHFTVDAVGEPGNRLFLIQGAHGTRVVTLKAEKSQIAVLSSYLVDLLDEIPRPGHLPEEMELIQPFEIEWACGSMAVTYDDEIDRLLLVVEEFNDENEMFQPDTKTATFALTKEQAAAVAIRSAALVEAGRPACPLCGHPIDPKDPSSHACPRTNGNRPPEM